MQYGSLCKAKEIAELFKDTERCKEETEENKLGECCRTQSNGGRARGNNLLNHTFSVKSV